MTLIDLILISKGLSSNGDIENIVIYRSTYDNSRQNPVEAINVN